MRLHVNAQTAFYTLLLLAVTLTAARSAQAVTMEQLRTVVAVGDELTVGGRDLHQGEALRRFYGQRDYRPVWIADGVLHGEVFELLQTLRELPAEGLRPSDYHLAALDWYLATARLPLDPFSRLELELLLTDAFLGLAHDIAYGRAAFAEPNWVVPVPRHDLVELLERALRERRVQAALHDLLPQQPGYRNLREAGRRYREAAAMGGWPTLGAGPVLRPGTHSHEVPALRAQLRLRGDLEAAAEPASPRHFDSELAAAVRRFQRRHGLSADAVVGPQTRAQLAVTVEQRLAQIELNLERWRRLPRDFGDRHILVNIADYSLQVVEAGETVFRQRVIVGQEERRTPVMSGRIDHLVLNPSWEVPRRIMVEDMLPAVRRNPDFFDRHGIEVLRGWAQERRIDPSEVDWETVSTEPFPYRFRQAPGPRNALGQVKFMFPNQRAIYLHDTPERWLFNHAERAYSSGCVRVERPLELTDYLLGAAGWDQERVRGVLADGREQRVNLPRAVPVHLVYWTAWADADGLLHFRDDVYAKDASLKLVWQQEGKAPLQIGGGEASDPGRT